MALINECELPVSNRSYTSKPPTSRRGNHLSRRIREPYSSLQTDFCSFSAGVQSLTSASASFPTFETGSFRTCGSRGWSSGRKSVPRPRLCTSRVFKYPLLSGSPGSAPGRKSPTIPSKMSPSAATETPRRYADLRGAGWCSLWGVSNTASADNPIPLDEN